MKYVKLFEDFKKNNIDGSLITQDDIIKCIENGGIIYATIIQEMPGNDPSEALKPVDIDEDGLITIEYNNKLGYVKLEDVEKINF